MPTQKSKSKSRKNLVQTTSGSKFYIGSNGLVRELRRGGYFSTINTINFLFNRLYRDDIPVNEVVIGIGRTPKALNFSGRNYATFVAEKGTYAGNGLFKIGCYRFDLKNSRKLFLLSGVRRSYLNRYLPAAKAAAAGR